jgi:hypothetical protein
MVGVCKLGSKITMEMCMLLQVDVLESMSTSSHYLFQMKGNAFVLKVHKAKQIDGSRSTI